MTRILPKAVADSIGMLAAYAETIATADDATLADAKRVQEWLYDESGMIVYDDREGL